MTICNLSVLSRDASGNLKVDDTNPPVTQEVRRSLVQILETAPVVRGTTATIIDLIEPDRGEVVGLSIRTDGKWLWNDSVLYYLREHNITPPDDFVQYYTSRGFAPRIPSDAELAEVELFLS